MRMFKSQAQMRFASGLAGYSGALLLRIKNTNRCVWQVRGCSQPQHVRLASCFEFFRHTMDCECAAADPLDTAALREAGSWGGVISMKQVRALPEAVSGSTNVCLL